MVDGMDGDGSTITYVIIFICLVLLAAFFNASQTAIVTFNDSKLKKLSEDGNKKAEQLLKITKSPSRFMDFCDICAFLFAMGAMVIATWLLRDMIGYVNPLSSFQTAMQLFVGHWWGAAIVLLLWIVLITFVVYTFSYMLPKKMAAYRPERFAFFCIAPLRFFKALFFPFVAITVGLSNGLSRLFGVDPDKEKEDATEEEIRMMVDVGNEKGVIEESQKDMINNIFEFDDRTAEDVMTHRTEVVAVSQTATISDIVYYAINEGFSRIPVYEDDIDNIVGVIYVKDLLCLVGCKSTEDFKLSDFIRPVLYVPESNRCRELFKEFTDKKIHMAVVVDEYGGTSGIVTMEDLLESIVGNIQDEYDDEEIEIQKMNDTTYIIDGSADLEEVAETLGLEISENEDYDTLGGLITDILGRIPDDGEMPAVSYQNVDFTVLVVEDRRVVKVKAVIRPDADPEQENEPDKEKK
ncbi:MAG: hemolysin family protein [Clostridiales bacterium]|nr:hemolysin family protein [Clostridiales bacterium]